MERRRKNAVVGKGEEFLSGEGTENTVVVVVMAGGKEGKRSTVYHIVPREEAGNGGGGNGAGVGHGGDGGGGGPAAGEQQQAGRESERQALSFVDLGLGIFFCQSVHYHCWNKETFVGRWRIFVPGVSLFCPGGS